MNYYSGGGQHGSINKPCSAVTTIPKQRIVCPIFIDRQYGNSKPASADKSVGRITANHKWHYLLNPQYSSPGGSVDKPCFYIDSKDG